VLDVGVVYPVVLRLWRARGKEAITDERFGAGLRILESWLVRRMIMRRTSQNLQPVRPENSYRCRSRVSDDAQ